MDSKLRKRINRILALLLAAAMLLTSGAFALENDDESIPEDPTVENEVLPIDISEDIQVVKYAAGSVELKWNAVENATTYTLRSDDYNDGETLTPSVANDGSVSRTFNDLTKGVQYTFIVEAFDENNETLATGSVSFSAYNITFNESEFRKLGSKRVTSKKMNTNLRKRVGEGYYGYAVVQGSCTDGIYAYYMMTSSSNQKGRVVKIRISDNVTVKVSPYALDTHHANSMTYDSKRGQIVAVGYGKWRNQLTFINPNTLTVSYTEKLQYPYKDMEGIEKGYNKNGIAAISYIEKYNIYLTRVRGDKNAGAINDIMVFDADTLKLIGYIKTTVTAKYPGTYQDMDADERYVYFLLSPGTRQPNNIILVLDWNAESIMPVVNGDSAYIEKMWSCNNNGGGKPDAVLTLGSPNEAEGLYHTTDKQGRQHFYLSEYYGRVKYKTVTKKYVKKKKWKKVKKKVKVKWKKVKKKVKVNGKWKTKKVWKYKWKTKKVWKKKYGYKKVKVREGWARDDYVYDLGII